MKTDYLPWFTRPMTHPSASQFRTLVILAYILPLLSTLGADLAGDKRPPGSVSSFTSPLAHFDLEIPVADDSGVMKLGTLTSDPTKGFATDPGYSAFFWANTASQMVFSVPPNGATTPNSHFPRTELSQKKEERWKVGSGNHTLRGTFSITSIPKVSDKGEITVAQIHDNVSDNGPLLKLICDYKSRPWKILADYRVEPKKSSALIRTEDRKRPSITLNALTDYEIILGSDHVLTVKVRKNGTQTWSVLADSKQKGQVLDSAWDNETCYFKAGCYMFDPGPTATPTGEIHYSMLSVE